MTSYKGWAPFLFDRVKACHTIFIYNNWTSKNTAIIKKTDFQDLIEINPKKSSKSPTKSSAKSPFFCLFPSWPEELGLGSEERLGALYRFGKVGPHQQRGGDGFRTRSVGEFNRGHVNYLVRKFTSARNLGVESWDSYGLIMGFSVGFSRIKIGSLTEQMAIEQIYQ